MAKRKTGKGEAIIPQAKLLRLFQIIAVLKTGHWSIRDIAARFDTSERTVYRYIKLLEEVDFIIDKDFDGNYFIHSSDDDPGNTAFSREEMKLIKRLIETEVDNNPLRGVLLKKLSFHSELDNVPRIIVKARHGKLVETLALAMRQQRQTVLKNYHSANSSEVADRLIEPIEFGDNYQTVIALDLRDKVCKQFKIDRIGEVISTQQSFQHAALHQKTAVDIFGMSGATTTWITLALKMRAYLLLREDFPLSLPYIEKLDDGFRFFGPVNNFHGIGRFVLGLLDEVEVVGPVTFKQYLRDKLAAQTLQ